MEKGTVAVCSSPLCILYMSRFFSACDILSEQELEYSSDEGLDKEQLREEGKGEVIANQLHPVGQQGEHIEALVVGVVQESGDQAHGRAHEGNRCADDGAFKLNRMSGAWIEYLAGQLKGAGASHKGFQRKGQNEFHDHNDPNGDIVAAHIHAAHFMDGIQNAAGLRHERTEGSAVYDIQAVEYIGMHGNQNGQQGKNGSLKLISWHK